MSDYLTVLIPAAGSSLRFRAAGIDVAKPLIEFRRAGWPQYGSAVMVDHAIGGSALIEHVDDCVLAVHHSKLLSFEMAGLTWKRAVPIFSTRGQADTILQSLAHVGDGQVLVVNCDQGFAPGLLFRLVCEARRARLAHAALMFDGDGSLAYSYAEKIISVTGIGTVFEGAVEKMPATGWALAGAFWFRDARELATAIANKMVAMPPDEEPYLSQCLANLGRGLAVKMNRADLYEWGTPEMLAADKLITDLQPDVAAALEQFRRTK